MHDVFTNFLSAALRSAVASGSLDVQSSRVLYLETQFGEIQ
jgi:hypothetical protein